MEKVNGKCKRPCQTFLCLFNGTTQRLHYLPGGSVMVETVSPGSTTGTKVLYYGYQDHLGLLTALVRERINGNGTIGRIVADYRSYDAWGRLRDPNNSLFQHEYGLYDAFGILQIYV